MIEAIKMNGLINKIGGMGVCGRFMSLGRELLSHHRMTLLDEVVSAATCTIISLPLPKKSPLLPTRISFPVKKKRILLKWYWG